MTAKSTPSVPPRGAVSHPYADRVRRFARNLLAKRRQGQRCR